MLSRHAKKKIQYCLMNHPIPLSVNDYNALRTGPIIFANSLPKAGTHLLRRLLSLLPNTAPMWSYHFDESINGFGDYKQLCKPSKGQVVTAHIAYSKDIMTILDKYNYCKFFMMRDPRDAIVSGAHYITNMDHTHRLTSYFKSLSSDHERIMAVIKGIDGVLLDDGVRSKSISEHLNGFLGWIDEPSCCMVKFEELIGSSGGGTDENQYEIIGKIIEHIGISIPDNDLTKISSQVFSTKSKTFRKGQINNWKGKLSDEHVEEIKNVAGDALIKMGYESDLSW